MQLLSARAYVLCILINLLTCFMDTTCKSLRLKVITITILNYFIVSLYSVWINF